MSPRPGTITAIQVILYIRSTLGVLSLLAVLTGWGPTSGSEVWRVTWDTAVFDVVPGFRRRGIPVSTRVPSSPPSWPSWS